MNTLRAFLLPAAMSAALIAPLTVFAQQASQAPAPGVFGASGHGHRHGRHHGFMRMLRGVDLTDQQKTQMKQIVDQYRRAHPAGSQMDRQARRQSHQQLRAQLMNVLTPQQRAQVEQNMQQMREPSPEPSQAPEI